jgi:tRNA (guanine-N7-)-methyltransferase
MRARATLPRMASRESGELPLIEFPVERLDWERMFEVARPVQVEIGAGKGRFLIRAAMAHPECNWVGLERRWTSLALGVERIAKRKLMNALYVRCDAGEVVRRLVLPGSVAAYHVYYPDPWWKKRHEKRRLFTPAFVGDLARGLAAGGELRVATDVADYFEEIVRTIEGTGLFGPLELPAGAWGDDGEPLTSYEAKYLVQGREPRRAAFRRGTLEAPPPEPWLSRKPRGRPLGEKLIAPKLGR